MAKIDFYFDFTSPYSYLAWKAMTKDCCVLNSDLEIIPIMVGKVFSLIESTGPGEVKAKREYLFKDVLRKAKSLNIELKSPATMPFNPLPILRFVDALKTDRNKQILFITKAFDYGWRDGRDYGQFDEFKKYIIDECSITSDEYSELEGLKEPRRNLKLYIKESVDRGVFGVPTFIIDNEVFWGLDSMMNLKEYLKSNELGYSKEEFTRFLNILEGVKND